MLGRTSGLRRRAASLLLAPARVLVYRALVYDTFAFRTMASVQRFVPWAGGTPFLFRVAAISTSDLPFASIVLIVTRHP